MCAEGLDEAQQKKFEVREILKALKKAFALFYLYKIKMLSNAQEVIQAIKRGSDWMIETTIKDDRCDVETFMSDDFNFMPRNSIEAAKILGRLGFIQIGTLSGLFNIYFLNWLVRSLECLVISFCSFNIFCLSAK